MVPAALRVRTAAAGYERQVADLQEQVKALEEEVVGLRRRLQDAPKRVRTLEERLLETKGQLAQAVSQNEKLSYTLREAREHIAALRRGGREAHPAAVGLRHAPRPQRRRHRRRVLRRPQDARRPPPRARRRRAQAGPGGRAQRVAQRRPGPRRRAHRRGRHPQGAPRGRQAGPDRRPGRRGAGRRAGRRRSWARSCGRATRSSWTPAPACCSRSCPGPRSRSSSWKRCPTSPTTTSAASTTRSSRSPTRSSCRSSTASCSSSTSCRRPRASCSTALPAAARRSSPRRWPTRWPRRWPRSPATQDARSYFLNIKGPELLNKYVGETERQIRLVFQRAREKSEEGVPVIVFFDEMDSLFRTRGTGICSDMESTIVPQLLAEIDGVETLKNVIVIGASNREDLIDPAILRPGPPRREDQDRAARRGRRPRRSSPATSPPTCRSTRTRCTSAGRRRPRQGRRRP